jgi:hypothetical protein
VGWLHFPRANFSWTVCALNALELLRLIISSSYFHYGITRRVRQSYFGNGWMFKACAAPMLCLCLLLLLEQKPLINSAKDWPISIFGLSARLRAHAALHASMAAPHVVLLQSVRWDLHAWFVSKGMRLMSAWADEPFVTRRMLLEYEVDTRAAFYEVLHAFPSVTLWGLVLSPPGVISRAKSDAPFLQATLNSRAQAAVKAVLKAVAEEFGFVIVDWGGMIESAGKEEECEEKY